MNVNEAVILYRNLKLHFNSVSYDYFKYKGLSTNKEIILNEGHYYIIEKTLKQYRQNIRYFYLANLVENRKFWINDFLDIKSNEIYKEWNKRQQSITYNFKSNIDYLTNKYENFKDCLEYTKNSYPLLLNHVYHKDITIESFIILNMFLNFSKQWHNYMKEDLLWVDFRFTCIKYHPFIKYNSTTIKEILSTIIGNLHDKESES